MPDRTRIDEPGEAPATSRIAAAGAEIEFRWHEPAGFDGGSRLPVVLLHHGFGCVDDWLGFPQMLSDVCGRRVLTSSRRGCGRSSPLPALRSARYLHEEAREHLPALLDALAIPRAHLLGHSDGATIALLFAAMHPDRTATCTAEAPHVFAEDLTVRGVAAISDRYRRDASFRARVARDNPGAAASFASWSAIWTSPQMAGWSIADELAGIRCPLLVLQGEADPYGSLAHAGAIEAKAKGPTQVQTFERGGHTLHAERPDEVARLVARFIDRHHEEPP